MQKKIFRNIENRALVVCSGGLDSMSVALSMLQDKFNEVSVMSFFYGQKATRELEVVKELATKYKLKHLHADISGLSPIFGVTQLTSSDEQVSEEYNKTVVVPLRNALFLQIAMIYAHSNKLDEVWLGSHADDCIEIDGERMFPDNSTEFYKTFQLAMDFGTFRSDKKVAIKAPSVMGKSKAELIDTAWRIDKEMLFASWSCYTSGEKQCGRCSSCLNRKKAFKEARIIDKTVYEC